MTHDLRAPTQAGFRSNFRVEDNAAILKLICERAKHLNVGNCLMFIDLEKAYDRINHLSL